MGCPAGKLPANAARWIIEGLPVNPYRIEAK
jgi:hypothetical protein